MCAVRRAKTLENKNFRTIGKFPFYISMYICRFPHTITENTGNCNIIINYILTINCKCRLTLIPRIILENYQFLIKKSIN